MHRSNEMKAAAAVRDEPQTWSTKLLLVDHHVMTRQALGMFLESALPNTRVRGAATVPEALAMVADEPFHAAVVDCDLPGRGDCTRSPIRAGSGRKCR